MYLDKKEHCQLHGDPSQSVHVFCSGLRCAANGGVHAGDVYNGGLEQAQAEAAAAWNRRASPEVQALILEEVEKERERCVSLIQDMAEAVKNDGPPDMVDETTRLLVYFAVVQTVQNVANALMAGKE